MGIVENVYKDKFLRAYAKKVSPEYWGDILSYIAIELIEKESNTISLYSKGELTKYVKQIIYLSKNSHTSPFAKQYELHIKKCEMREEYILANEGFDYKILQIVLGIIEDDMLANGKYPYELYLWRESIEHSLVDLSQRTGKSLRSVQKTVADFKKKVKKKYYEYIANM